MHEVLALDAFARCWVQEDALLRRGGARCCRTSAKRAAFERLQAAWRAAPAGDLARLDGGAGASAWRAPRSTAQRVDSDGMRGSMQAARQRAWPALGLRGDDAGNAPREHAMAALAERLDARRPRTTDALIALHGLDGRASGEVLARLARHYADAQAARRRQGRVWGGVVSGALAGLKADLASGGLTLGGGLLAGGVLGALGAAGPARGYNLVRGVEAAAACAWDPQVLDALCASALLGYLAVAHHGRGRGDWAEPSSRSSGRRRSMPRWPNGVTGCMRSGRPATQTPEALGVELNALLQQVSAATLVALYPGASMRIAADA